MNTPGVRIVDGSQGELREAVRLLFEEYADSLGFDLEFQGFPDELASLPGEYAPPQGRLLLALVGDEAVGCIGLRPLGEDLCELKRLYVRPGLRGQGIARSLAEDAVSAAREIGYSAIVLDTLRSSMAEAIALYCGLGFTETEPYRLNPFPDALYLRLDL